MDRLIALTPRKQQAALTAKALTTAEAHPNKLTAATFLLQQDQIDRAAALIDSHPQAFDGRYYGSLLTLANALQEAFPAQAWVLYRSLLLSILEENRSKAYRHAADYLAIAATLAAQAGLHGKHQALLAQLQAQHGRKRSFWSLVKR